MHTSCDMKKQPAGIERWYEDESNPLVSGTLTSPLQVAPPTAKANARLAPVRGDYEEREPSTCSRQPTVISYDTTALRLRAEPPVNTPLSPLLSRVDSQEEDSSGSKKKKKRSKRKRTRGVPVTVVITVVISGIVSSRSSRNLSCEFRIKKFGLDIRDREVETTFLLVGFHVWSSAVADDELWRDGGLVRRPGLWREGLKGERVIWHVKEILDLLCWISMGLGPWFWYSAHSIQ
ncbi:hypothetical protein KIW84_011410 [Lathyrus oleraceus]|uniref:Uncharacterized protein n=1 Tax=Pisum sativum TaxID=3888 RepID=A0A9D5BEU9_PEA|nr:hypothetical protein KIW84_011410 [Pisum sativum]